MELRPAKGLERMLMGMDLDIQDWEQIVGNHVCTPQGLYFGIDMNRRSLQRVVNSEEGKTLLDEAERDAGLWSHGSEWGIPKYENIFRSGLRGLIQQAETRFVEIDREVPVDDIDVSCR